MNKKPKVSIVISARNEQQYLGECLKSIQVQTYQHDLLELLLVDSDSSDDTPEIIKNFADKSNIDVKILSNPRGDTPKGLNTGIKAATGDLIMFLNAHSYMANDFIMNAIPILREKEADGIGGRIFSIGSGKNTFLDKLTSTALETPFGLGNTSSRVGNKAGWIHNPWFAIYKHELFDKFGYLDERLTRNQDYEFNQRCISGGAKFWFQPDLKIFYHNRPSVTSLWRRYFYSAYWRAFMIGSHKGAVKIRHLVPSLFIIFLIIFSILHFLWGPSIIIAAASLGLYVVTSLVVSIEQVFRRKNFFILFLLPIILFGIHISFGLGMISGFFNFIVMGKRRRIKGAFKQ